MSMQSTADKTRIKLCGLTRPQDIDAANAAQPAYIGFVFAPKSRRYVSPAQAAQLKSRLDARILAVGVFVDEAPAQVAQLLADGVIDIAQLHGHEDETYLAALRALTARPILQAFRVRTAADVQRAMASTADYLLLDGGSGNGECFDWDLLAAATRPYFLAGGLDVDNVAQAVHRLHPYAVDVSSGIETNGAKDAAKMQAFCQAVQQAQG